MKNDEAIEILFTLHFYDSELRDHLGHKGFGLDINEYNYPWFAENFNIQLMRSLLFVDNEHYRESTLTDGRFYFAEKGNYIK